MHQKFDRTKFGYAKISRSTVKDFLNNIHYRVYIQVFNKYLLKLIINV